MADMNQSEQAELRVIPRSDGTFAVEVLIPDSLPTMVTSFATELAAAEWIAEYHRQLEDKRTRKSRFRSRAK